MKFQEMLEKDAAKTKQAYTPDEIVDVIVANFVKLLRIVAFSDTEKPKLEKLAKVIDEKSNWAARELQKHEQLVNETDSLVISMRETLLSSDSVLVKKFCGNEENLNHCLDQQNAALTKHVLLKPFQFENNDLESLIKKVFDSYLRSIKWPEMVYMSYEETTVQQCKVYPHISLVDIESSSVLHVLQEGYLGLATVKEDKIFFSVLPCYLRQRNCTVCALEGTLIDLRKSSIVGRYCYFCKEEESGRRIKIYDEDDVLFITISGEFLKVLPFVNFSSEPLAGYLALLYEKKIDIVHAFDPTYVNDEATSVTSEPFPVLIPSNCLFFFNNPEPNCLIWDPELKVIRPFLEIVGYENIPCEEKPFLLTCSKVGSVRV